jgi:HD superfamily phosphodiesterase
MYEGMEHAAFVHRLFELAEPYLAVRGDLPHARVSYQYALRLLAEEGGEAGIVEPAVILHDVGWSQLEPKQIRAAFGVRAGGPEAERLNRIHEREGAVIARRILQSMNYPPGWIERIAVLIERHDSGEQADSPEEKILKDADKLWRFSAEGYWQEIARQGLERDELHRFLSDRYRRWFFTATAVRMAEEALKERGREIAAGFPSVV